MPAIPISTIPISAIPISGVAMSTAARLTGTLAGTALMLTAIATAMAERKAFAGRRARRCVFGDADKGMILDHGKLRADDPLDVAEQPALLAIAEAEGRAGSAGAGSAPDPVHVGLRLHGELVIHDVADVIHVDSAGGD